MSDKIDLRILELMCSRLCHELISPVTAIGNGMELLGDELGAHAGEVHAMIATSIGQASNRLQFYRVAYGLGGGNAPPLAEARHLADLMLRGGKIRLDWPETQAAGGEGLGRLGIKLLLNTVLLGAEALPRGGVIGVEIGGAKATAVITARGQGARIGDESRAALALGADPSMVSARAVHAYFIGIMAAAAGGGVRVSELAQRVILSLDLPSGT